MNTFATDANPSEPVNLDDVRAQVKALEEQHRAAGIPLSGRVIHVCHYLPVTAVLDAPAQSSIPSPPASPPTKTLDVDHKSTWRLTPRIGHSAMISGIRSLSATHEQVIIGWTGDLYVGTAPQTNPQPIPEPSLEATITETTSDISAQIPSSIHPVRLPQSALTDESKKGLEDELAAYDDRMQESDYTAGPALGESSSGKRISLRPVFLDDKTAHSHYEGYCKATLWPLFHYLLWQDVATEYASADQHWPAYEAVNKSFAAAVLAAYQPGDVVWVHDYHLLLVPRLLRSLELEREATARGPAPPPKSAAAGGAEEGASQANMPADGAVVGLFLHTPFPSSEIFRCLPRRKEILEGMLGANLVCFQTYSYSRHFTSACVRVCGYEISPGRGIDVHGHVASVMHCSVGVDAERVSKDLQSPGIKPKLDALRALYEGKKIIVGRDKLDVVKGVVQKLRAFEKFLHDYPQWIGNVVLIQVTSPTAISPDTAKLERQVSEIVARINGEFGALDFIPVHHYHQTINKDEFYALLSVADLAVITPFRDGMNTTSMEFVLAQELSKKSPLVLSEFMGISNNMSEALQTNPWDLGGMAQAMHHGLTMSDSERTRRHSALYKTVATHTSHVWAAVLVRMLLGIVGAKGLAKSTPVLPQENITSHYTTAKKRLFLFDYDGTLTPIVKVPSMATPSEAALEALGKLSSDPRNVVYIISGRDQAFLEEYLGHFKQLGMSAEHGGFMREPGQSTWTNFTETLDMEWMGEVHEIFKYYTERTTGSHIELKKSSITWHYRSSDPEWGLFQCRQCQDLLENNVANKRPIDILVGKKNLEVRPSAVNKGEIVKRILYQNPDAEFVFCAGDDKTDEDMFRALLFPSDPTQPDAPLVMEPPIAITAVDKSAKPVQLELKGEGIFSTAVGHSSKRTLAIWHVTTPAEVVDSMLNLVNGGEGESKL